MVFQYGGCFRIMLRSQISPSLMCAPLLNLRDTLDVFNTRGIEYLHIDIMDGVFVPNFCLGTDFCRQVRSYTSIPFDIHLMVTEPLNKLDWFDVRSGDIVSVHLESCENVIPALEKIRSLGALPFLAVNPDTPISSIKDFLSFTDGVLLMTVYPGFAGQSPVEGWQSRIKELRALLDDGGFYDKHIEVDGSVSFQRAPVMRDAGADIFVSGTSGIFRAGDLSDNSDEFRRLLK